jgi:hypothetical protein
LGVTTEKVLSSMRSRFGEDPLDETSPGIFGFQSLFDARIDESDFTLEFLMKDEARLRGLDVQGGWLFE